MNWYVAACMHEASLVLGYLPRSYTILSYQVIISLRTLVPFFSFGHCCHVGSERYFMGVYTSQAAITRAQIWSRGHIFRGMKTNQ